MSLDFLFSLPKHALLSPQALLECMGIRPFASMQQKESRDWSGAFVRWMGRGEAQVHVFAQHEKVARSDSRVSLFDTFMMVKSSLKVMSCKCARVWIEGIRVCLSRQMRTGLMFKGLCLTMVWGH